MGMGGGGGPQTVTNKTELPAWLEAPIKKTSRLPQILATNAYEGYGWNSDCRVLS